MIKDLIWKLMEEATAETEHKGWCDTELTTNKQTREYKTGYLNELTAEEEDLTASIAKLTQDIEDLTKAIAELEASMAGATEERATSKATALAQKGPAEDAPETFDAPYKGMLPEGGNVVDFLEVILTDFARLESDTTTAEATELAEYKKYYFESEKTKALKETIKGQKEGKKSELESTLQSTIEELKSTQEELEAAIAYYEKLKPTCWTAGSPMKTV